MLSEEQKRELGLTQLLPASLDEALEALEKGRGWMEGALGKEYVEWFVTLKGEEMKMWKGMDIDERRLKLTTFY